MNKVILIIGMSLMVLFIGLSAVDIVEANDVINACKHKDEGMVRIVDNHSECRPSELPVTWSATGGGCPCWDTELLNQVAAAMVPDNVDTWDDCSEEPYPSSWPIKYEIRRLSDNRSAMELQVSLNHVNVSDLSVQIYPAECESRIKGAGAVNEGAVIAFDREVAWWSHEHTNITTLEAQACVQALRDSDIWARCDN